MRLDKFLAHNNFGSRKDVKKIIKSEVVTVNNKIITNPGTHINAENDEVSVNDEIINYTKNVYYMLNKPAGYISSHDTSLYPSVLELITDFRTDLMIVGRLDVDTEGLLLITSDGQFSHQIAHGNKEVYKQYHVELETDFDTNFIKELEQGIDLEDESLKPAKIEMINDKTLLLSIAEGKYHQVKRMMHYCNNEVSHLKRVKIGKLALDENLDPGEYRTLTSKEIKLFNV